VTAIAWKAFLLYRRHKRASKLPGAHVSAVESLDRTWTTCENLTGTCETREIALKRDEPERNLLATVVDRGRTAHYDSAPLILRDSAARFPQRPVTWENLTRRNKTWIRRGKWPKSYGTLRFRQTGLSWPPRTQCKRGITSLCTCLYSSPEAAGGSVVAVELSVPGWCCDVVNDAIRWAAADKVNAVEQRWYLTLYDHRLCDVPHTQCEGCHGYV